MATLRYSKPGGVFRIRIDWQPGWENTEVYFDLERIATISTKKELQDGVELPTPDDSKLKISLGSGPLPLPVVELDGQVLVKSVSDHQRAVKNAWWTLLIVGTVTTAFSALSYLGVFDFGGRLDAGPVQIAVGIGFLVAAYFVHHNSAIALTCATILYCGSIAFWFRAYLSAGEDPPIGPSIIRVAFAFFLIRGVWAMRILATRYPKTNVEAD